MAGISSMSLSMEVSVFYTGFPRALEIMENLEITKKFHAWKNKGV